MEEGAGIPVDANEHGWRGGWGGGARGKRGGERGRPCRAACRPNAHRPHSTTYSRGRDARAALATRSFLTPAEPRGGG